MKGVTRLFVLFSCMVWPLTHAIAQPTLHLFTEEYPPFNQRLPNGQIGGMATDMVRELFRRAELPYHIELQQWIHAFNNAILENNSCVYSTTRTEDREHQFRWIGPLVENTWALFTGPGSPKHILSLEDAKPYVIGGYSGDAESQYLVRLGFNLDLIPDDALNLRKLQAGRIQFWASSRERGGEQIRRLNLTQIKPVLTFNTVYLYLACNPLIDDSVISRLNSVLNAMQHDGFAQNLRRQYQVH